MSERPTCELCGHPMPEGEEMFKFHGYSGPCPGPRTKPMGGVPEVIELHGEKWVRIDVVRKLEEQLADAEARLRKYEPEPGKCEHGVAEGDWCEPCNREYKAAAEDEAAKGGRE